MEYVRLVSEKKFSRKEGCSGTESMKPIDTETAKIIPLVKRDGYIPTVDHKVPLEVFRKDYKYYLHRKSEFLVCK